MSKRNQRFNMVMSAEERLKLKDLAQHYGVSESDVVRMMIREDFRRLRIKDTREK